MTMQDGIRAVQQAFTQAPTPPRWPMYVRQAKQFLRNAIENFDERKYGFASVVDLLRAAGKEGVVRIERDRQGAVRVFPGTNLQPKTATVDHIVDETEETVVDVLVDAGAESAVSAGDGDRGRSRWSNLAIVDGDADGDGQRTRNPERTRSIAQRRRPANVSRPRAQERPAAGRKRKAAAPAAGAARHRAQPKTARPRARKTTRNC